MTAPRPALSRMYTPQGRVLHYVLGPLDTSPLCNRVPWWRSRAIEGRELAQHPDHPQIKFEPERADSLGICAGCEKWKGQYT